MAIDADLNTGAITDEEAKIRRAEVQRESDFFGAMDGATKFVKGDAIISIITALINLIGGAVLGIMHGQDINSVLSTYSLATVGDGICSQIPALMISVAIRYGSYPCGKHGPASMPISKGSSHLSLT